MAFSFQSKYLGMSPYRCPSLFSILSFLEYEHGVYHPIGGCGAVTDAMARIAREMGVDILLGEEAREILFEGRKAVGVRTEREVHAADALVINADFARAMTRLVPDGLRRRWTDRRIARKRFSCSTFMLYLGIEGCYDHLAPSHHLPRQDYAKNLREIEDQHVLSEIAVLLRAERLRHRPVARPAGHEYALRSGARDTPASECRLVARARTIPGAGAAAAGQDRHRRTWRSAFASSTSSRRPTGSTSYEIHRGATFNLAHNLGQMLHLRPRNRFEDLERCTWSAAARTRAVGCR